MIERRVRCEGLYLEFGHWYAVFEDVDSNKITSGPLVSALKIVVASLDQFEPGEVYQIRIDTLSPAHE